MKLKLISWYLKYLRFLVIGIVSMALLIVGFIVIQPICYLFFRLFKYLLNKVEIAYNKKVMSVETQLNSKSFEIIHWAFSVKKVILLSLIVLSGLWLRFGRFLFNYLIHLASNLGASKKLLTNTL